MLTNSAIFPRAFRYLERWGVQFITWGDGDAVTGHRCPGEPLAVGLLVTAVLMLTRCMDYAVPAQDLHMEPSRMPAQPESLCIMADVRPREA